MIQALATNRALVAFIGVLLVFLLGAALIPGFASLFSPFAPCWFWLHYLLLQHSVRRW